MLKKFISFALVLTMVLAMAVPAIANGVTNSSNDGTKVLGNGSSFGNGIRIVSDNSAKAWLIWNDTNVDADVSVRWQVSNQYFNGTFTVLAGKSFRLGDTNGKNGINNVWYNGTQFNTPEVEPETCEPEIDEPITSDPIVVNLGFIGHYLHDGRVLTTSFYWQTLNEGDMIDWNAVEAAYAAWVANGGLAPNVANGWQSSGFAPIFFADGAEIGHSDFSFDQLEGYYRAYFVSAGYVLEEENEEEDTDEPDYNFADGYSRYLAYVEIWNDIYWVGTPQVRSILVTAGNYHYNALLAYYGADNLPAYTAFDENAVDQYEYWADVLEASLQEACDLLGLDLADFVRNHASNQ